MPHLQQKDRVDSARRMIRDFGCDVLVLDDGFQHRRLHRDFDLVLIDALQPWGYGHILPRGLLRERRSGLRRADLVVITRANQCSPEALAAIRRQLKQVRGTDECVEVAFNPTRLVDHNWQPHSLDAISGKTGFAFCGIGNPTGFLQTVGTLGLLCQQTQLFPDHHHYDSQPYSDTAKLKERNSG